MVNSKFTALIAVGLAATLVACSAQSDKDKLMEAQFCLDEAGQGQAASCVASLASLQSSMSYVLQCSAKMIDSGITTPSNLAKALSSVSGDSASSSTTELLTALNMGDVTTANETAELCAKSNQAGFALLGAMAKSATLLASASQTLGSCTDIATCDEDEIKDVIEDLKSALDSDPGTVSTISVGDAENQVKEIASAVQTVYNVTCGTATASKDICGPIQEALASVPGSPDIANMTEQELIDLGTELLKKWKP